ncbi:hypothetical protein M8J75_014998 [Diaphorina citri]|nr:hypothetical protein M8J75_014998 [Diaphorina citri]
MMTPNEEADDRGTITPRTCPFLNSNESVLATPPPPSPPVCSDMTEKQADILAAILGYILFDFVWCLSCNCEPLIMKAHHFVCILLIVLVLSKGNTGAELIFIFGVNQVTNFLLQLRWFLRYHGFNNGIVEFLFVISFFVERVWLTFTLFDRIAKSSSVPLEFKIFLIFHCVIGYVFSYHVALLVLNKCCRSKNKPPVPSTISFDQYEDQGDFDDDDGVTEEEHCGKTKSNSLPYDKSNSPLYDKSNTPYDTDSECHCE